MKTFGFLGSVDESNVVNTPLSINNPAFNTLPMIKKRKNQFSSSFYYPSNECIAFSPPKPNQI
jgi:hypothetical protein